jgi:glutamyl-tRNA reductase
VRQAMKIRKNRSLLLLDLAVPRDVDPRVAKLTNVFLHDLDALGGIVAQSLAHRRAEIPKVEAIVEVEMSRFLRWHRSLAVVPTVTAFRGQVETIAKQELERHKGKFRAEDHAALDALVHGIVQKLLHKPTTKLTRADEKAPEGIARIDAIRDLFGIDEEDSDADRNPR